MGFNQILSSIFGNKSTRDMKEIQPWVNKVKAVYPEIQKLDNDALRAKTEELKAYIRNSAAEQRAKVDELKAKVESTELEDREELFNQIDKLEKEILDLYEKALDDVLPTAFAIVKDTARRFTENEEIVVTATDFDRQLAATKDFVRIEDDKAIYVNHWQAGGNEVTWNMVHYDVQLFGGVVLHKGKIAEMATGEGKTLVATLPVFLNALTGNGVHVVTVNDYLSKRDSEWMGPLYMFHGLSVDCIDKYQPNSDARRKAYLADITFGTNNEFGFDYLRDNMAISPKDLVQRQHNYAIVDEVDSVLIDDARTPLIISGPVPKGDDQLFEQLKPFVERLVEAQKKLATQYLADAKRLIASDDKKQQEEGFLALYRSHKCLPKNKALIKFLSEQGIKAGMLKTEEIYMEQNNRRMHEVTDPLYFVIEEKLNSVDLTDKGVDLISGKMSDPEFFVLPDITAQLSALENETNLTDEERLAKKDALLTNYAIKSERVHTINQLLKAYTMFEKDDEYVVIDGQVKIVDEQTGRIMEGRRYSDGLHQAIEAKEGVKVEAATQTRHDRYGRDGSRRVLGHLQAGRGGHPHQPPHRPHRHERPRLQDEAREIQSRHRGNREDGAGRTPRPGGHHVGGNLRDAEQDAGHAQDSTQRAQRQVAPEGGRNRGQGRTEQHRDHRHQHGRPWYRHQTQPRGESRRRSGHHRHGTP